MLRLAKEIVACKEIKAELEAKKDNHELIIYFEGKIAAYSTILNQLSIWEKFIQTDK